MAQGQIRNERARAAGGDERPTTQRDQFLKPPGSQRCADSGLCDRQSPPFERDLEDWKRPHLGPEAPDLTPSEFLDKGRERIPEKAQDDVWRQVKELDREVWLEHSVAGWIEVE